MSTQAELHNSRFDVIKWVVVAIIVAAGVYGNCLLYTSDAADE